MRKLLFLLIIFAGSSSIVFSQDEPNTPRVTVQGNNVKISYGQPSKRGRDIFGRLVPFGQVWRTGANAATEITFIKNAKVGGKPVKAGTYTLFTIPGNKQWTIILNSVLNQWGATKYDQVKSKNVLQVAAPASVINGSPVEAFSITLPNGKMVMQWDKTRVDVPLTF